MKVYGNISRYSPWAVKLIVGFLSGENTVELDDVLSGVTCLETNHVTPLPTVINIHNVRVVVKEIKILEENHVVDPVTLMDNSTRLGYVGSFTGSDGSRTLLLNNQYPIYRQGQEYVWRPTQKNPKRDVTPTLKRLRLPKMFYDLECLSGHLELCVSNTSLSDSYRERIRTLLNMIRRVIEREHPRWQYSRFSPYFKGIALYRQ